MATDDDGPSSTRVSGLRSLESLTRDLTRTTDSFGKSIANAFAKGIVEGKRFEDVLRSVGKTMVESLLKTALKPLTSGLSSLLSSGVRGLSGLFTGAGVGGSAASPAVLPFADGGVIAAPTYFPLGRSIGLAGERGTEAIMPLSRGPDGRLGVHAGGQQQRSLNVTVHVSTPDADSFRRSEAQVSAAIARAVARGRRAL